MNPEEHLKSTTTAEEDLHSASQRGINLTWENTQRQATLMIIGTTCVGVLTGFFVGHSILPAEWWAIVGLVVGFYFSRTNHSQVGGVKLPYAGR